MIRMMALMLALIISGLIIAQYILPVIRGLQTWPMFRRKHPSKTINMLREQLAMKQEQNEAEKIQKTIDRLNEAEKLQKTVNKLNEKKKQNGS